ncbi:hypothetical protein [Serratia sp. CY76391]|uniref:hypothetical protein n=1 Tax=Serratia sp. CY76391 TaxID=3383681 RepID=UPI003FA0B9FC
MMRAPRMLRLGMGGLLGGVLCFVSPAGATQTGADFLSAIQGVQVPDTPVSGSNRGVKGARPASPAGQPASTHPPLPRQVCTSSVALSQVRARLMAERAAGQRAAAAADTRLTAAKKREADLQGTVATLQARITALQSQQTPDAAAKTAAQSAQVQQVTAELVRVKAQLQQRVVDQTSAARLWQHAMVALQGQLAVVTTDNRQRAGEKVQLAQAQATAQSLAGKLQHTQAQLAALTRQQDAQGDKAQQVQTQIQKTLSDQNAALQAQLTAATQQQEALKAKMTSLTDASSAQQKTLSEQNAALQAQLTAATQQQEALKAKMTSLTDASSTQQKTLSEQNAALQTQLAATTQQRDALSIQVASLTRSQATEHQTLLAAQAKPVAPVTSPPTPAVSLTDARSQQTYASGVVMASTLRRTLALQKDLGVSSDPMVLLAGVTDGVQGTLKLDRKVLNAQYAAIIQRLSDKEKGRFDAGIKRLEAVTAKKTVLKRNGSLFFVQTRKGAQAVKTGETLQLSVRESLLDGKVLRDDRSRSVTLNGQLPYMLQQAVLLGGRGGVMEVYCFASDIYPPERLPDGLFGYSLMKYTVSIGAQA